MPAVSDILDYLGVTAEAPTPAALGRLMAAWGRRIPWESASRVARHAIAGTPDTWARKADAYFADALAKGTGGTCFESNFALNHLLMALGYGATLAFCDMGDTQTCHCANLVRFGGEVYVADGGYTLPGALPLRDDVTLDTGVYMYRATGRPDGAYEVSRSNEAVQDQNCFTLHPEPVEPARFWERLVRDHQPGGYFLDQVIVVKTFPDEVLRFSRDKGLIRRSAQGEETVSLTDDEKADLPATLAARFGVDQTVLRTALDALSQGGNRSD